MDSINIITDVLPEEMPMTVMQSMKLGIDVNRHKVRLTGMISSNFIFRIRLIDIGYEWMYSQGKICRLFSLLIWGWIGGIVILACCEYHLIRVHENLLQHPSNIISFIRLYK